VRDLFRNCSEETKTISTYVCNLAAVLYLCKLLNNLLERSDSVYKAALQFFIFLLKSRSIWAIVRNRIITLVMFDHNLILSKKNRAASSQKWCDANVQPLHVLCFDLAYHNLTPKRLHQFEILRKAADSYTFQ